MKSFIVIGLGRFGRSVAKTLSDLGHDVLAIDNSEDVVLELSDSVTHVIQADVTNEDVIKSLGVKNFDAAVVAIGDDIQSSILATVLLKELGARHIIAKAQNELHAKVLYKVGADKVVFVERDMGMRIARNLVSNNIEDMIELSSNYSIVELKAPSSWDGKTLEELSVRSRYGANIVAIKKDTSIDGSPGPCSKINEGDVIVVFGKNKDLSALEKEI